MPSQATAALLLISSTEPMVSHRCIVSHYRLYTGVLVSMVTGIAILFWWCERLLCFFLWFPLAVDNMTPVSLAAGKASLYINLASVHSINGDVDRAKRCLQHVSTTGTTVC